MPDESQQTPDVYTDQFTLNLSPYGALLLFGVTLPSQTGTPQIQERLRLRMSLEHAKVMTMLLRRVLKGYERENALTIPLPRQVLNTMGLSPEDDW